MSKKATPEQLQALKTCNEQLLSINQDLKQARTIAQGLLQKLHAPLNR